MGNTRTTRPKPPENLSDESLLEWHRITAELDSVGKLDTADRALLTIYCRTWQTWTTVAAAVARDGPIVLLQNNWPGESPESKAMTALTKQLTAMLAQLGLTPTSRKATAAPVEDEDVSF